MPIGLKVTLRASACALLEKLITVGASAHPRLPGRPDKSFDGRGNYSLGLKEQLVFPRSNTTRSTGCAAWRSRSSRQRKDR